MAADLELFPRSRRGKIRPCPHCRRRRRILLAALAALLVFLAGVVLAVTQHPGEPGIISARLDSYAYVGDRMLDAAETRVNDPYSYGAAGPYAFDCSGLVYWAAGQAGERSWPRDTYDIAWAWHHSSRFTLTTRPQRGDLALWGPVSAPYHVEFVTIWPQTTFGAETYGWAGRVTWHYDGWWHPWFYLHINW
jgi:NlpC/P60 family